MRITAEQWTVLSRLLDEALEVPQEARESWLESLGELDAVLKGELRLFLERHARIETSDFLDTLPKFRTILLKAPQRMPRSRPGCGRERPSDRMSSNRKSVAAGWGSSGGRGVPMG
jgi:hypothetical protein